jgi:hypothetical protein
MADKEALKTKLKDDIEKASWEMLKDHHERGAVFLVDPALDLTDVGACIALDDVNMIKIWLDNGQFTKLESIPENDDQKKRDIKFLIIQPYVLIQLPN